MIVLGATAQYLVSQVKSWEPPKAQYSVQSHASHNHEELPSSELRRAIGADTFATRFLTWISMMVPHNYNFVLTSA